MKAVEFEGHRILLSKFNDRFYATSAVCPHAGAQLETGVLSGTRLTCPWHHSSFNIEDGLLLEPPALDGLSSHEVLIEGDKVFVRVMQNIQDTKTPLLVRCQPDRDDRIVYIIGAGAAGTAAALALREACYFGQIKLISSEADLPYDRTSLSKSYMQGNVAAEALHLRSSEFYKMYDIDFVPQTQVHKIDAEKRTIWFAGGESAMADAIFLAMGSKPRQMQLSTPQYKNMFTLRSLRDAALLLKETDKKKKITIAGASFIANEVAWSLANRGMEITMIAPQEVPFQKTLGTEIGQLIRNLNEEKGIHFINDSVTALDGHSSIETVRCKSGQNVQTELLLVAIGVEPATSIVQGIAKEVDGGIATDANFCAADGIYAIGDIARFPYWYTGEKIRIEHWRTAEQHGRIAAMHFAGRTASFASVPFFWTNVAGLRLRYIGYASSWDNLIIKGDLWQKDFIVYYIRGNKVVAALGSNQDQKIAGIDDKMRLNLSMQEILEDNDPTQ